MDCNTHDCLFSFFNNVRGFWLNIVVYHKDKAYFATYTTMTYGLTSIILMSIFYKHLDFFGVALAILISSFISLIVVLITVKKLKYPIYGIKYIFFSILIMLLSFSVYIIKINFMIKAIMVFFLGICVLYLIKKLLNVKNIYEK